MAAVVLAATAALTTAGTAQAQVATLIEQCYDTVVGGAAFPQPMSPIATTPPSEIGAFQTAAGVVTVNLVRTAEGAIICRVLGTDLTQESRATQVLTRWPAVKDDIARSFGRLSRKSGVRVIGDRVREDSLGVAGYELVKCSEPTALALMSPGRLSDAGFVQPPFSMDGQDNWTFDVVITTPLFPALVTKHC